MLKRRSTHSDAERGSASGCSRRLLAARGLEVRAQGSVPRLRVDEQRGGDERHDGGDEEGAHSCCYLLLLLGLDGCCWMELTTASIRSGAATVDRTTDEKSHDCTALTIETKLTDDCATLIAA